MRWLVVVTVVSSCAALSACAGPPRILEPNLTEAERVLTYEQRADVFWLKRNGLGVLLLPSEDTNLVRVAVRYPAGAAADPPGKRGTAHLLEHLTFEVESSGTSLTAMLEDSALYHNATTGLDQTRYFAVGLADKLTELLFVEALRMRATCDFLTDDDIARERAVVQNELDYRSSDAHDALFAVHGEIFGDDHPYARSVGGTRAEVASINRDVLCRFVRRHHHPQGAQLVISGNFDVAAARRTVVQLFSAIKPMGEAAGAVAPPRLVGRSAPLRGTSSVHRVGVQAPQVWAVFAAAPRGDSVSLTAGLGRRVVRRALISLLRDKDYVVDFDLGRAGGARTPLLVVELTLSDARHRARAVDDLFEAIDEAREELIPARLAGIRERMRTQMLFAAEGFADRARLFGEYFAAGSKTFLLGDLQTITGIGVREVQAYMERVFRRESSHVAFLLPSGRATADGGLLARVGDVIVDDVDPGPGTDRGPDIGPLPLPALRTGPTTRRFTLDNGVEVVLAPDLTYPLVEMRLVLPVGVIHEPEDRPGLAHATAASMAPDPRQRIELDQYFGLLVLDQMGIDFSESVGQRSTTFTASGLAMYADALIWQLYWRTQVGRPSADYLATLRKLASPDHLDGRERSAAAVARALADALYGPAHPYARRLAVREGMARVSHDDAVRFRERFYRPRGATLIVTGKFDAESVVAEIRRLFGSWSGASAPAAPAVPPATDRRAPKHVLLTDDDAPQLTLAYGFATRAGYQTDHAARLVLGEILRIRFGSLRTELGATYGVMVNLAARRGPGELLVVTDIDPDKAKRVHTAAMDIFAGLRRRVPPAAFVAARKRVVQRLLAQQGDSRSIADELEARAVYGVPANAREQLLEAVARLRPRDVAATIAADMPANRVVVVGSGPRGALLDLELAARVSRR